MRALTSHELPTHTPESQKGGEGRTTLCPSPLPHVLGTAACTGSRSVLTIHECLHAAGPATRDLALEPSSGTHCAPQRAHTTLHPLHAVTFSLMDPRCVARHDPIRAPCPCAPGQLSRHSCQSRAWALGACVSEPLTWQQPRFQHRHHPSFASGHGGPSMRRHPYPLAPTILGPQRTRAPPHDVILATDLALSLRPSRREVGRTAEVSPTPP